MNQPVVVTPGERAARAPAYGRLGRWRLSTQELAALGVFALLLLVVGGPMLTVVWISLRRGLPGQSSPITLQNFARILENPEALQIIANTMVFAALTIAVMFFFLLPLTFLLTRSDLPFKRFFIILMSISILVPTFLGAIGWILLLSPQIGVINRILIDTLGLQEAPLTIYSMFGMAFVQGLSFVPGSFFMLSAAYTAMDPALEDAAYTSGLGKIRTFLRVTLPVTAPATLGVLVYFFMLAISVFEAPAIIGIPGDIYVMSSIIYYRLNPNVGLADYGGAAAFGMIMLVIGLLSSYFYFRTIRHSRRYAIVSGKGYRPKMVALGQWKWAAVAFVVLFLLLQPGLPLAMLIWTSLTPYMVVPSVEALNLVTLENYVIMFAAQGTRMVYNTIVLVLLAPLGAMVLSIMVAWIVTRTQSRLRVPIDVLAFLPHAVPSILFAIALNYVALINRDSIPLYGTVFLIVIAHAIAYLAFGSRTLNSVMIQIQRDLEEAGRLSGLSALGTLRRIVIPLVAGAIFSSWFWIALLSYREVTMALILFSRQNDVIATGIWQLWSNGRTGEVAALGTVLVAVAVSLAIIVTAVTRRALASSAGAGQGVLGR